MDDALAQLTREWITKAAHDLQAARIVGATPDGPLDAAIFHCQQTAEKALKGWLTAREISFEKTHDLRRLAMNHQNATTALRGDALWATAKISGIAAVKLNF